jgi:hypothetical protein
MPRDQRFRACRMPLPNESSCDFTRRRQRALPNVRSCLFDAGHCQTLAGYCMLHLARSLEPGRSFGLPRQLNPGGGFFSHRETWRATVIIWPRIFAVQVRRAQPRYHALDVRSARSCTVPFPGHPCELHIAACGSPHLHDLVGPDDIFAAAVVVQGI